MATKKLSIRQKMINMMYLVLLAILALNVSAEVLKAFYTMEVSLEKTGENIDAKNQDVLKSFAVLMKNQPNKTKEWNKRALKGEKIEKEFVQYVENLKQEIEEVSGGRETDDEGNPAELKFGDNTEKHANYLLNKGKAKELKEKINATRDKLLALVPFEDRKHIKTDMFTLDNDEGILWETHTFEGVPVAAVMASLTKIQNDCKNTYADVLNILYTKVADTPPIDKLVATIIPKSKNVMVGEEFEAEIMLSAYDSKQAAEIVIDGKTYQHQSGTFRFNELPNSQGKHEVKGKILVKEKDGVKEYPFSTTYNVFGGAAAVSADKMNIMYVGLKNPISVSVPGVPSDKVVATITNGTLQKVGNNQYIAKVNTSGEVYITISERKDDGTIKQHGRYTFRAKDIPDPEASLGAFKKRFYTKGALIAQNRLYAVPKFDIGFAGVNFKVLSYEYMITVRGELQGPFRVRGSAVPQRVKDLIRQARKGDNVIFRNIVVQGPTKTETIEDGIGYIIK